MVSQLGLLAILYYNLDMYSTGGADLKPEMKPEITKLEEVVGWQKDAHRFECIKINGFNLPVVLGAIREYGLMTLEIEVSGVEWPHDLLLMGSPWEFEFAVCTPEANILYSGLFMGGMVSYSDPLSIDSIEGCFAPLSSRETYTFGCRSVTKTVCPVQPIEFVSITCKLDL
jgi:hypothetical protein